VEFSLDARRFLHSSSVAGCPSRTEKNLCRRIDLMRSNECEVYHPSRSYEVSAIHEGYAEFSYIAGFAQRVRVFDHVLQHGVDNVAELEGSGLFRHGLSIEYVRVPASAV